jgi:hypothetical protein|tara:strand:- start:1525 stop:1740 length:216 start_codon:yes stop_codon:yes gene_type:complete
LYKVSADAYESNNFIRTTLAAEEAIAKSILILGGYKSSKLFFLKLFPALHYIFFRSSKKDAIPIRAKKVLE